MYLAINPADDLPIYRQIMRQIMDAIAGGRLQPGERLTSHRELSEQLVIAPLTVKKAYDELEALGYIESQRGRGTFVSARLPKVTQSVRSAQLKLAAQALL
ncbi:MAG: GntR family transcriptional regulator, partial [Gemmatimonadaceae bacterium]